MVEKSCRARNRVTGRALVEETKLDDEERGDDVWICWVPLIWTQFEACTQAHCQTVDLNLFACVW